jgi:hypothetical protein
MIIRAGHLVSTKSVLFKNVDRSSACWWGMHCFTVPSPFVDAVLDWSICQLLFACRVTNYCIIRAAMQSHPFARLGLEIFMIIEKFRRMPLVWFHCAAATHRTSMVSTQLEVVRWHLVLRTHHVQIISGQLRFSRPHPLSNFSIQEPSGCIQYGRLAQNRWPFY